MIRTHSISSKEACLMAVAALDELVNVVVKGSGYKAPASFFDWIAEEGTPLVELQLAHAFHNKAFARGLRAGDPRIALSSWVTRLVAPYITARFALLAPHMPAAAASVADMNPPLHEGVYELLRTWRPGRRLARLLPHPPISTSPVAGAARAALTPV